MAHATNDLFCPLYKEVIEQKPWESVLNANQGLLFDKFASGWQKQGTTFEFDKAGEPKGQWLRNFASKIAGDKTLLTEACTRQRNLVEKMGGKTMLLTNTSRFITGMGREHPLDNGFTWHHTLGVPYLPGSSLKGVLRAWYRENGTWDEAKEKWGIWNPNTRRMEDDKAINQLFGSQEKGVGQFILLDILPSKPPQLVVEIMTPHYGDYYRDYQDKNGQKAPGDWLSPNPITFLAVEAGQSWQLAVLPGPSRRSINSEDINNLQSELLKAFAWLGAGAKTAIGYGRFEQDLAAEEELNQRIERQTQIPIGHNPKPREKTES
jgi:CRISPR-associated protein Cmr6